MDRAPLKFQGKNKRSIETMELVNGSLYSSVIWGNSGCRIASRHNCRRDLPFTG